MCFKKHLLWNGNGCHHHYILLLITISACVIDSFKIVLYVDFKTRYGHTYTCTFLVYMFRKKEHRTISLPPVSMCMFYWNKNKYQNVLITTKYSTIRENDTWQRNRRLWIGFCSALLLSAVLHTYIFKIRIFKDWISLLLRWGDLERNGKTGISMKRDEN